MGFLNIVNYFQNVKLKFKVAKWDTAYVGLQAVDFSIFFILNIDHDSVPVTSPCAQAHHKRVAPTLLVAVIIAIVFVVC